MLIFHYNDNTTCKIDGSKYSTYMDIKKELFQNKFKRALINPNDLIIITFGEVVKDSDTCLGTENQVHLVKINFDVEFNKIYTDDRLVKLLSNESSRKIFYEILENPDILNKLKKYKYQKELDDIKNMGFRISENEIKDLLDKNSGNMEIVVGSLLNL